MLNHEPGSWQDPAKILEGSLEVRIPARCWIMNQDPGRIGKDPCRIQSHEPGSWQDPEKILEGSLGVRIPGECRIMNQDPAKILPGTWKVRIPEDVESSTRILQKGPCRVHRRIPGGCQIIKVDPGKQGSLWVPKSLARIPQSSLKNL